MVGLKDRGTRDLAGLRGPEDGDIFLSSLRPTTGFEKAATTFRPAPREGSDSRFQIPNWETIPWAAVGGATPVG